MTDRDALLAAVLAAPDDDAPRLIFADWLDEHGDSDYAELIRIQCGHTPDWPVRVESYSDHWCPCCLLHPAGRGYQLLHQNGERTIFGRLPPCLWSRPDLGGEVRFRRGFVDAVECSARDWLRHGDSIVAAHPVREVRLATRPELIGYAGGGRFFDLEHPPTDGEVIADCRQRWPSVRTWHLLPEP